MFIKRYSLTSERSIANVNMGKPTDLSVIIVASNVKDLVRDCLTCVKNANDKLNKEIIFVDNGSSDGTVDIVKEEFPEVRIIKSEKNLGFARANNLGYQEAAGRHILLLNSDAFIGKDTLQKTVEFMDQNPRCGILGCSLVDINGRPQPSARNIKTPWRIFLTNSGISYKCPGIHFLRGLDDMTWDRKSAHETGWVPGCFLLVRKSVIDGLGFFLRNEFFMYNDDSDLCLRAKRKGWKIVVYPEKVLHLCGESSRRIEKVTNAGRQILRYKLESELIYFRKNYNFFYALEYLFFTILQDLTQMAIKLIRCKKDPPLSDNIESLKLTCRTIANTKFGEIAAY